MYIIAFEGIDASGKETQAVLLKESLERKGFKVAMESFPRYSTPIGGLLKKWLEGHVRFPNEAAALLQEADKIAFTEKIDEYIMDSYDFLILDRFALSNLAYGMAQGMYLEFLRGLQNYIPKPDLTFILDIDVETSFARKEEKSRDLFEQNAQLLSVARDAYIFLAGMIYGEGDNSIRLINGKDDIFRIHAYVMQEVNKLLRQKEKDGKFTITQDGIQKSITPCNDTGDVIIPIK